MNLTSYGCSFIFGTDLPDSKLIPNVTTIPSQQTWPAKLADHLGLKYHCRAYAGCGNLLIAERILLDLENLCRDTQLVVVGWTWIDRFDYNNVDNIDNWNTIRPGATDSRAEFYFKNLHSEYRDKLTSLLTIKTIIDTLQGKKLPFLMTYMDDLLFDTRWNISESITYLQNYVRPHMTSFDEKNFLEWSRQNGYEISPTLHPLLEAHKSAGDYMINFFNKHRRN